MNNPLKYAVLGSLFLLNSCMVGSREYGYCAGLGGGITKRNAYVASRIGTTFAAMDA